MKKNPVSSVRVPLEPLPYVLNGDRYCWWLTKVKPKKSDPAEMIETDSLGYYPTLGDCLRSLPKRDLARDGITTINELIDAVRDMESTLIEMKNIINEKVGGVHPGC